MTDETEELKKLSPKERIKKLKEIQEKDKAEIEEAQKLLNQAEDEAVIEEELKDIPVPQLKAVDIDQLFSPEEKELFKAKRFEVPGKKEETETKEDKTTKKETALEAIAETAPRLSGEEEKQHIDYLQQLSQKPTQHLYNKAKELYSEFKNKGYLTPSQQDEFKNIEYANQKKFDDIESGRYSEVSQAVAQEMSLIEKMKGAMYKK